MRKKTHVFKCRDGIGNRYKILEFTNYIVEQTHAEDIVLEGVKEYETSEGYKCQKLENNHFIFFDGLQEIKVEISLTN